MFPGSKTIYQGLKPFQGKNRNKEELPIYVNNSILL